MSTKRELLRSLIGTAVNVRTSHDSGTYSFFIGPSIHALGWTATIDEVTEDMVRLRHEDNKPKQRGDTVESWIDIHWINEIIKRQG